ncbi:hypothetical protein B0T11DRAFT_322896 [Plectosphaerella cucumerina]|uniref:Uncharacterized protein n=1 Tax=Plectosphaerella cucumerina TaxID=40658 RepID=A0A8K0TQU2_9PEZI|nr:hypothetical protein B0T11DRAFT_322896 [Plectosphaerella cucumerina]
MSCSPLTKRARHEVGGYQGSWQLSLRKVPGFGPIDSVKEGTKDQLAKIIIAWIEENKANLTQAEREGCVLRLLSFIQIVAAMKLETNIAKTARTVILTSYATLTHRNLNSVELSFSFKDDRTRELYQSEFKKSRLNAQGFWAITENVPDNFANGLTTRFFIEEEINRIEESALDIEWVPYVAHLQKKPEYTVDVDGQNQLAYILTEIYAELD